MPAADKIAKRTQAPIPHERDFYFDELMTAQPEATGEFLRQQLKQQTPTLKPKR